MNEIPWHTAMIFLSFGRKAWGFEGKAFFSWGCLLEDSFCLSALSMGLFFLASEGGKRDDEETLRYAPCSFGSDSLGGRR